jgi:hypothetical protein
MHFHSPLSKKSEKRKASTTSTVSEDAPVEKTPSIKLVKQPKNKNKKMKRKARTATPEDPHPQSPSPTLSRSASQDLAASSPADTILQQTYVNHTQECIAHRINISPDHQLKPRSPRATLPQLPDAARASRTRWAASRIHGTKLDRISSVLTARSCRWNIRVRRRTTGGTAWRCEGCRIHLPRCHMLGRRTLLGAGVGSTRKCKVYRYDYDTHNWL